MIRITESLDIALIARLRKMFLGAELDDTDSLCYHQVLTVEEVPLGAARFHREGTAIVIDCVAVCPELPEEFHEMLSRSMVAHALDAGCDTVVAKDGRDFYTELGFSVLEEGVYAAQADRVRFPCKCRQAEEKRG